VRRVCGGVTCQVTTAVEELYEALNSEWAGADDPDRKFPFSYIVPIWLVAILLGVAHDRPRSHLGCRTCRAGFQPRLADLVAAAQALEPA
jgi:hypothetical protein